MSSVGLPVLIGNSLQTPGPRNLTLEDELSGEESHYEAETEFIGEAMNHNATDEELPLQVIFTDEEHPTNDGIDLAERLHSGVMDNSSRANGSEQPKLQRDSITDQHESYCPSDILAVVDFDGEIALPTVGLVLKDSVAMDAEQLHEEDAFENNTDFDTEANLSPSDERPNLLGNSIVESNHVQLKQEVNEAKDESINRDVESLQQGAGDLLPEYSHFEPFSYDLNQSNLQSVAIKQEQIDDGNFERNIFASVSENSTPQHDMYCIPPMPRLQRSPFVCLEPLPTYNAAQGMSSICGHKKDVDTIGKATVPKFRKLSIPKIPRIKLEQIEPSEIDYSENSSIRNIFDVFNTDQEMETENIDQDEIKPIPTKYGKVVNVGKKKRVIYSTLKELQHKYPGLYKERSSSIESASEDTSSNQESVGKLPVILNNVSVKLEPLDLPSGITMADESYNLGGWSTIELNEIMDSPSNDGPSNFNSCGTGRLFTRNTSSDDFVPDFDEIDDVMFISFCTQDSLEAHVEIEKQTQQPRNKHKDLLEDISHFKTKSSKQKQKKKKAKRGAGVNHGFRGINNKILLYERMLCEELGKRKHHQTIHPDLKKAGITHLSQSPAKRYNLAKLGVNLDTPKSTTMSHNVVQEKSSPRLTNSKAKATCRKKSSKSLKSKKIVNISFEESPVKEVQNTQAACSLSRPPDEDSGEKNESTTTCHISLTADPEKWRLPESESKPFKPFELPVTSKTSAFVSKELDEYLDQLQNRSSVLTESTITLKPVSYFQPDKPQSYVRTLDMVLKRRNKNNQLPNAEPASHCDSLVYPSTAECGETFRSKSSHGKLGSKKKSKKTKKKTKVAPQKVPHEDSDDSVDRMQQELLSQVTCTSPVDTGSESADFGYMQNDAFSDDFDNDDDIHGFDMHKSHLDNQALPMCGKDYCKLGCLCGSVDGNRTVEKVVYHCRKIDCMFGCTCDSNLLKSSQRHPIYKFQEESSQQGTSFGTRDFTKKFEVMRSQNSSSNLTRFETCSRTRTYISRPRKKHCSCLNRGYHLHDHVKENQLKQETIPVIVYQIPQVNGSNQFVAVPAQVSKVPKTASEKLAQTKQLENLNKVTSSLVVSQDKADGFMLAPLLTVPVQNPSACAELSAKWIPKKKKSKPKQLQIPKDVKQLSTSSSDIIKQYQFTSSLLAPMQKLNRNVRCATSSLTGPSRSNPLLEAALNNNQISQNNSHAINSNTIPGPSTKTCVPEAAPSSIKTSNNQKVDQNNSQQGFVPAINPNTSKGSSTRTLFEAFASSVNATNNQKVDQNNSQQSFVSTINPNTLAGPSTKTSVLEAAPSSIKATSNQKVGQNNSINPNTLAGLFTKTSVLEAVPSSIKATSNRKVGQNNSPAINPNTLVGPFTKTFVLEAAPSSIKATNNQKVGQNNSPAINPNTLAGPSTKTCVFEAAPSSIKATNSQKVGQNISPAVNPNTLAGPSTMTFVLEAAPSSIKTSNNQKVDQNNSQQHFVPAINPNTPTGSFPRTLFEAFASSIKATNNQKVDQNNSQQGFVPAINPNTPTGSSTRTMFEALASSLKNLKDQKVGQNNFQQIVVPATNPNISQHLIFLGPRKILPKEQTISVSDITTGKASGTNENLDTKTADTPQSSAVQRSALSGKLPVVGAKEQDNELMDKRMSKDSEKSGVHVCSSRSTPLLNPAVIDLTEEDTENSENDSSSHAKNATKNSASTTGIRALPLPIERIKVKVKQSVGNTSSDVVELPSAARLPCKKVADKSGNSKSTNKALVCIDRVVRGRSRHSDRTWETTSLLVVNKTSKDQPHPVLIDINSNENWQQDKSIIVTAILQSTSDETISTKAAGFTLFLFYSEKTRTVHLKPGNAMSGKHNVKTITVWVFIPKVPIRLTKRPQKRTVDRRKLVTDSSDRNDDDDDDDDDCKIIGVIDNKTTMVHRVVDCTTPVEEIKDLVSDTEKQDSMFESTASGGDDENIVNEQDKESVDTRLAAPSEQMEYSTVSKDNDHKVHEKDTESYASELPERFSQRKRSRLAMLSTNKTDQIGVVPGTSSSKDSENQESTNEGDGKNVVIELPFLKEVGKDSNLNHSKSDSMVESTASGGNDENIVNEQDKESVDTRSASPSEQMEYSTVSNDNDHNVHEKDAESYASELPERFSQRKRSRLAMFTTNKTDQIGVVPGTSSSKDSENQESTNEGDGKNVVIELPFLKEVEKDSNLNHSKSDSMVESTASGGNDENIVNEQDKESVDTRSASPSEQMEYSTVSNDNDHKVHEKDAESYISELNEFFKKGKRSRLAMLSTNKTDQIGVVPGTSSSKDSENQESTNKGYGKNVVIELPFLKEVGKDSNLNHAKSDRMEVGTREDSQMADEVGVDGKEDSQSPDQAEMDGKNDLQLAGEGEIDGKGDPQTAFEAELNGKVDPQFVDEAEMDGNADPQPAVEVEVHGTEEMDSMDDPHTADELEMDVVDPLTADDLEMDCKEGPQMADGVEMDGKEDPATVEIKIHGMEDPKCNDGSVDSMEDTKTEDNFEMDIMEDRPTQTADEFEMDSKDDPEMIDEAEMDVKVSQMADGSEIDFKEDPQAADVLEMDGMEAPQKADEFEIDSMGDTQIRNESEMDGMGDPQTADELEMDDMEYPQTAGEVDGKGFNGENEKSNDGVSITLSDKPFGSSLPDPQSPDEAEDLLAKSIRETYEQWHKIINGEIDKNAGNLTSADNDSGNVTEVLSLPSEGDVTHNDASEGENSLRKTTSLVDVEKMEYPVQSEPALDDGSNQDEPESQVKGEDRLNGNKSKISPQNPREEIELVPKDNPNPDHDEKLTKKSALDDVGGNDNYDYDDLDCEPFIDIEGIMARTDDFNCEPIEEVNTVVDIEGNNVPLDVIDVQENSGKGEKGQLLNVRRSGRPRVQSWKLISQLEPDPPKNDKTKVRRAVKTNSVKDSKKQVEVKITNGVSDKHDSSGIDKTIYAKVPYIHTPKAAPTSKRKRKDLGVQRGTLDQQLQKLVAEDQFVHQPRHSKVHKKPKNRQQPSIVDEWRLTDEELGIDVAPFNEIAAYDDDFIDVEGNDEIQKPEITSIESDYSLTEERKKERSKAESWKPPSRNIICDLASKTLHPPSSSPADKSKKGSVKGTFHDISQFLGEPQFMESVVACMENEELQPGRLVHNIKERQRRQDQATRFRALKEVVLLTKPNTVSKKDILTMAVDEIQRVRDEASVLIRTKTILIEQNALLKKKLRSFPGVKSAVDQMNVGVLEYESEEDTFTRQSTSHADELGSVVGLLSY